MVDRFDLESKITDTYHFVDHINDLSYGIIKNNLSQDEITDALHGLSVLLKFHTDKLFEIFTQAHKLDSYNDDT